LGRQTTAKLRAVSNCSASESPQAHVNVTKTKTKGCVDQRGRSRRVRAWWACFHTTGVRKFLKEATKALATGRRRATGTDRAISRFS